MFVWLCGWQLYTLHLLISGHDRRTVPKFGSHVLIDTLTVKKNLRGLCGENFEIYHANQQFNTCLLTYSTCQQTRKIRSCAYCMHTYSIIQYMLMLIKIKIENTQSTLESKNISNGSTVVPATSGHLRFGAKVALRGRWPFVAGNINS